MIQLLECTAASGSRTQGTIALSSGEAELYAIGQCISETLYVGNLLLEAKFAKTVKINVRADSTAGKAIASRFGAGKKSKHIELRYLYMQELVQRGVLALRKVGTLFNCSDVGLLKSHLTRLGVVSHFFDCKLENNSAFHTH